MAYNENAASCIKSTSQVEDEMGRLADSLQNLDDAIANLGNKISPVLVNDDAKCASGNGACPISPLVPLASSIRERRERVESLIYRVQSFVNRIEL